MTGVDVVVVGGGAIGLASAWRLAQGGLQVAVCDPAPGSQATHASAGMLAPVTEAHYGEDRLLRLNLASARRWPDFAAELEATSGASVGYRACSSLLVAFDRDDARVLQDLGAYLEELGLEAEARSGSDCRRSEPALAPGVCSGLWVAGDHQVDNRLLAAALLATLEVEGVAVLRKSVRAVDIDADAVRGVVLDDGTRLTTDRIVLAAAGWSAGIDGLPPEARPPVRPVKGQILRLRRPPPREEVPGLVLMWCLWLLVSWLIVRYLDGMGPWQMLGLGQHEAPTRRRPGPSRAPAAFDQ